LVPVWTDDIHVRETASRAAGASYGPYGAESIRVNHGVNHTRSRFTTPWRLHPMASHGSRPAYPPGTSPGASPWSARREQARLLGWSRGCRPHATHGKCLPVPPSSLCFSQSAAPPRQTSPTGHLPRHTGFARGQGVRGGQPARQPGRHSLLDPATTRCRLGSSRLPDQARADPRTPQHRSDPDRSRTHGPVARPVSRRCPPEAPQALPHIYPALRERAGSWPRGRKHRARPGRRPGHLL
jgi:hypothetical protein